jgi:hypothetical protein
MIKDGKTAVQQTTGDAQLDQDLQRSHSDDFFHGLRSTALPVPEVILI